MIARKREFSVASSFGEGVGATPAPEPHKHASDLAIMQPTRHLRDGNGIVNNFGNIAVLL